MTNKVTARSVDREGSRRVRESERKQQRTLKQATIRQGERAFQILLAGVNK